MAQAGVRIEVQQGATLKPVIPALARLRTEVFRDWPYLYDGDLASEERYLATYAQSPRAAVVVASVNQEIVGASTCLPLSDESDNVQRPFRARGWDPARFFDMGESVLRREMRGQGIGVAFFEAREAHATCGFGLRLCRLLRSEGSLARSSGVPTGYVPLDAFWTRRGFTRRPDGHLQNGLEGCGCRQTKSSMTSCSG